jgi:PAS domain S-box-containing protein
MRNDENNPAPPGQRNSPFSFVIDDDIYHKMIEEVEDYSILLLDTNGIIKNWNKGEEKIKGYSSKEIINKRFHIFYSKEDRKAKLPDMLLDQARKEGKATHEGWRLRKDGTRFWGSVVITSIHGKDNQVIGFSKVTRDLTERRKLEENILKAVINAQEKERNEISEELHDNVSQLLTTSQLLLQAAEKECSNPMLVKGQLQLKAALAEIRNISHRLNPSAILLAGIYEAINDLVKDINQGNVLQFDFSVQEGKEKLSGEIQLMLFRIVQEQVSNIIKHAGATRAHIDLKEKNKRIALTITDNGKGFQFNNVKKGLGLQNIFCRAELYKGTAAIISSPGKGCTIRVTIPVSE